MPLEFREKDEGLTDPCAFCSRNAVTQLSINALARVIANRLSS